MNWISSVYLLCTQIVLVKFIGSVSESEITRLDYSKFESKFSNETYNKESKIIIEDFYRQSSLAAKNVQDMNFHSHFTGVGNKSTLNIAAALTSNFSHNEQGNKQTTSYDSEGNKKF